MPFLNLKKITNNTHLSLLHTFASDQEYDEQWRTRVNNLYMRRKNMLDPWFPESKTDLDRNLYHNVQQIKANIVLPLQTKTQSEIVTTLSGLGFSNIDPKAMTVQDQYGRVIPWSSALKKAILNDSEIKRLKQERSQTEQDKNISKDDKLNKIQEIATMIKEREGMYQSMFDSVANLKGSYGKEYKNLEAFGIDINDLVVVLTQDPHQIAKMSYDRYWSKYYEGNPLRGTMECDQNSCMTLGVGMHHEDLFDEVEQGGCAAYLTTKDDTETLSKPLGRVWIRLFTHPADPTHYTLIPEDRLYGIKALQFLKDDVLTTIKSYLAEKQPEIPQSTYNKSGGHYSDSLGSTHNILVDDFSALTENFNDYVTNYLDQFFTPQAKAYFAQNIEVLDKEVSKFKRYFIQDALPMHTTTDDIDKKFNALRKFQFHYPALNARFTAEDIANFANRVSYKIKGNEISFTFNESPIYNKNVINLFKSHPPSYEKIRKDIQLFTEIDVHKHAVRFFSHLGFERQKYEEDRSEAKVLLKKYYNLDVYEDVKQSVQTTFEILVNTILTSDDRNFLLYINNNGATRMLPNVILPALNEEQLQIFKDRLSEVILNLPPGDAKETFSMYGITYKQYQDMLPQEIMNLQENRIVQIINEQARDWESFNRLLDTGSYAFAVASSSPSANKFRSALQNKFLVTILPDLIQRNSLNYSFNVIERANSNMLITRDFMEEQLLAYFMKDFDEFYKNQQSSPLLLEGLNHKKVYPLLKEKMQQDPNFAQYVEQGVHGLASQVIAGIGNNFQKSITSFKAGGIASTMSEMLQTFVDLYRKIGGDFVEALKPNFIQMAQQNPGIFVMLISFFESNPIMRDLFYIPEVQQSLVEFMNMYANGEGADYTGVIMHRNSGALKELTNMIDTTSVDQNTKESFFNRYLGDEELYGHLDLGDFLLLSDTPLAAPKIGQNIEIHLNNFQNDYNYAAKYRISISRALDHLNKYMTVKNMISQERLNQLGYDEVAVESLKQIFKQLNVGNGKWLFYIEPKLKLLRSFQDAKTQELANFLIELGPPDFQAEMTQKGLGAPAATQQDQNGFAMASYTNIARLACAEYLKLKKMM